MYTLKNGGTPEASKGYQAIADDLREQTRSGRYLPGALLPTERELQDTYGVSRSTVRRALAALAESGWAEIKPKRGVAARLGPRPEIGGDVAYVDHADLVDERVFFGISRLLQSSSFRLVHVDSRQYGTEGALEKAGEMGCVAAFVWSKEGFPDVARIQAVQAKMPVIALDHGLRGIDCDVVLFDNLGGSDEAVGHLAKRGRRRIAVSGMMDMLEINHERFSGYLKALLGHGLTPDANDFAFCMTSGGRPPEADLLARRLADPDRPDAVFVLQDMCVPPVVEAIFAAGLRVPEDVAVVGFGGEVPVRIDEMGLTTIALDWPAFAEAAVRLLESRLHRPTLAPQTQVIPGHLAIHGSCGAPPEEWSPTGRTVHRRVHRQPFAVRSHPTPRKSSERLELPP